MVLNNPTLDQLEWEMAMQYQNKQVLGGNSDKNENLERNIKQNWLITLLDFSSYPEWNATGLCPMACIPVVQQTIN